MTNHQWYLNYCNTRNIEAIGLTMAKVPINVFQSQLNIRLSQRKLRKLLNFDLPFFAPISNIFNSSERTSNSFSVLLQPYTNFRHSTTLSFFLMFRHQVAYIWLLCTDNRTFRLFQCR